MRGLVFLLYRVPLEGHEVSLTAWKRFSFLVVCVFELVMPSFDDVDSGLESLTTMESKDSSPKKTELNDDDELEGDDEELEETLPERLWGLTEMFPQVIRNSVWLMTTGSLSGIKSLYGFSRNAMWIFFSSSAILMAPVIFEVERAQMEEMQKQQQRHILLGPNAAVSGSIPSMGMPMPAPPSQPR